MLSAPERIAAIIDVDLSDRVHRSSRRLVHVRVKQRERTLRSVSSSIGAKPVVGDRIGKSKPTTATENGCGQGTGHAFLNIGQ